jgi:hypothetical protein
MNVATRITRSVVRSLVVAMAASTVLAAAQAEVQTVHTYKLSPGAEVTNAIAVDQQKLATYLPTEYELLPASILGLGGSDQGIVAIVNFRSSNLAIDDKTHSRFGPVVIDVGIIISQPDAAVEAGLDIPGAFHFYTLRIYSTDARYLESLRDADLPVQFKPFIAYVRTIDDVSGLGHLSVFVPDKKSALGSFNEGLSLPPAVGALNAIFWYEGGEGTAALHFRNERFQLGNAISRVFTSTEGDWGELLAGGGLGPCTSPAVPGLTCIQTPSLNLRYPVGTVGRLFLLGQ